MKTRYGKIYSLSSEEFKEIANNSSTLKEMLDYIGLGYRGHSYDTLKTRLKEEGIEFTSRINRRNNISYPNINDILIENSPYVSTNNLKKRLLKEGLLNNVCNICGQLPEHMGKPLTLQLDHINGIFNDHRLPNLRIICPQCHSQTSTYSGKNSKIRAHRINYLKKNRVNRINKNNIEILEESFVINLGSVKLTIEEFEGIINNKLAKDICKEYFIKIKTLKDICRELKIQLRYKNRPTKINITKDELEKLIMEYPKTVIGKMFGVSGGSIGKKCKTLGISTESMRGYWAKQRALIN